MEMKRYFKSVVKGSSFALIISFIAVIILSAIMVKCAFSQNIYNIIYVVISLIGLSAGSIIGARKNQSKGWLVGAGVAAFYYIILYLLCSLVSKTWNVNSFEIAKFAICILIGILSGMLGINL